MFDFLTKGCTGEKLRQRQQKLYSITEQETDQFLEFDPYATGSPNTVAGNDLSLRPQETLSETIPECQGSNILGLWDSWSPFRMGSEVNDWAISYPDTVGTPHLTGYLSHALIL